MMRRPARTLVLIEQDGAMVARMFDDQFQLVEEFDATSEEVVTMTAGLQAQRGAEERFWDEVLGGHSTAERAAAQVYTLDV